MKPSSHLLNFRLLIDGWNKEKNSNVMSNLKKALRNPDLDLTSNSPTVVNAIKTTTTVLNEDTELLDDVGMDEDIICGNTIDEDAEMDENIIIEEELQDIVSSCCNFKKTEGKFVAILNQIKTLTEKKCRQDLRWIVAKEVENIFQQKMNLNTQEQETVLRNLTIVNRIIGISAAPERIAQVSCTVFGTIQFHCQGSSNYCGLCAVNNALQLSPYIEVHELDCIADEMFVMLVTNPSIDITTDIQPFRDIEGFYNMDVLSTCIERKGYKCVRCDPNCMNGLNDEELFDALMLSFPTNQNVCTLLVKETQHQHYTSLQLIDHEILLLDSLKSEPIRYAIEQGMQYIRKYMNGPDSAVMLILSDRFNIESRVPSVPKNDFEARGTSPCGSIGSSMEQFEDVKIFLSPHFDQVFDSGYIGELGSCSEEVDLAAASAPIVESNIDCLYQSNKIFADKLISSDHQWRLHHYAKYATAYVFFSI